MPERIIMVSACLLGAPCRYDGGSKPFPELQEKLKGFRILPVCPEMLGNLTTPRPPAEIQNGTGEDVLHGTARVVNRDGVDCSDAFITGAWKTLEIYQRESPQWVILKANSPSCGVGNIYDGSFTGRKRDGHGVAAALLLQNGARLFTEVEFETKVREILDSK